MYIPDVTPVAPRDRLRCRGGAPLLTVFVTLESCGGGPTSRASRGVVVAIVVAIAVYGMPAQLALLAGTEGFVFGLFPIIWIVLNAIWLYEMTVASGRFDDLRRVIDNVSDDARIQAIIIAFCFGGLMEALAGFGAPVAITGVMLMAVGFTAMRAAAIVLLANTAPVAFGAIATPILTAGKLTGIDYRDIGAYVGHQTPLHAVMVPAFLVLIADGRRGLRDVWPVALVVGVTFAVTQWLAATYVSVELTDIIASLVSLAAAVLMLRVWSPSGSVEAGRRLGTERTRELQFVSASSGDGPDLPPRDDASPTGGRSDDGAGPIGARRAIGALAPYLLIVVAFGITKLVGPVKDFLAETDVVVGGGARRADRVVVRKGLHGNAIRIRLAVVTGHDPAGVRCVGLAMVGLSPRRAASIWCRDREEDALVDPHRGPGAGAGLRDEPVGPDDHHRRLDRRCGNGVRVLLPRPRVAGHRGDRFRHQRQRPLRDAAASRRAEGRTRPDAAGRGQHLRRRGRQDDQPQNLTIAATAVDSSSRESEILRLSSGGASACSSRSACSSACSPPCCPGCCREGRAVRHVLNDTCGPRPRRRPSACWRGSDSTSSSHARRPAADRCSPTPGTPTRPSRGSAASSTSSPTTTRLWRRPAPAWDPSGTNTRHWPPARATAGSSRPFASLTPRVHELIEFLVDVLGVTDVGAYFPHRVTYHPTCHSLRMLRVADKPWRLLRAVRGIDLVDLPARGPVLRFGGTFAVKNADTSVAMGADKTTAVRSTRAEVLVAGDNSCLAHIGGMLHRQRSGGAHDAPRRDPRLDREGAGMTAPDQTRPPSTRPRIGVTDTFMGMPSFRRRPATRSDRRHNAATSPTRRRTSARSVRLSSPNSTTGRTYGGPPRPSRSAR